MNDSSYTQFYEGKSLYQTINELSMKCYTASKDAGWWHDLDTGQPLERNKPEMLVLIHSEISEAFDGFVLDSIDDHLPRRKSVEVELADTLIRVGDFCGGFDIDLGKALEAWQDYCTDSNPSTVLPVDPFAAMHSGVSKAFEGYRKSAMSSDLPEFSALAIGLAILVDEVIYFAEEHDLDLDGAIDEKMAYNRERLDHKVENRRKDGGKKC